MIKTPERGRFRLDNFPGMPGGANTDDDPEEKSPSDPEAEP